MIRGISQYEPDSSDVSSLQINQSYVQERVIEQSEDEKESECRGPCTRIGDWCSRLS